MSTIKAYSDRTIANPNGVIITPVPKCLNCGGVNYYRGTCIDCFATERAKLSLEDRITALEMKIYL